MDEKKMDELENALGDVKLTAPWMEQLPDTCPFCGDKIYKYPGETSPNAGTLVCACGFRAVVTPPFDMLDKRWVDYELIEEEFEDIE